MPENRISVQLGEAEWQAVFAAVQTIRQKLPFLIDLTPEGRITGAEEFGHGEVSRCSERTSGEVHNHDGR